MNNRSAPPDAPAWPQVGPKIDSGPRTELMVVQKTAAQSGFFFVGLTGFEPATT
jgi:hypothetical protein